MSPSDYELLSRLLSLLKGMDLTFDEPVEILLKELETDGIEAFKFRHSSLDVNELIEKIQKQLLDRDVHYKLIQLLHIGD